MELANINCVASLFSLTSFCKRRRGTVGTNMQCVWDKPRKNPNPRRSLTLKWGKTRHNNLNLLLLRRTPSTQLYRFKDSEPTLRRSSKNFSGATDALFFYRHCLIKLLKVMMVMNIIWYCKLWHMLAIISIVYQLLKTFQNFYFEIQMVKFKIRQYWEMIMSGLNTGKVQLLHSIFYRLNI